MNISTFTRPAEDRYFEDYVEGNVYEFGPILVQQEEMISFSERFDPQDYHTNPEAAKESVFGGLIASGWHSGSMMMRLLVDHYLSSVASLGSPGVDEIRWLQPVRPGDELSVRITVTRAVRSRSKPDRGIVHSSYELLNQNREIVMTVKGVNFIYLREAVRAGE